MGNAFTKLSKEINKFNDVLNTMSILIWDSRTKMPKKGANSRGYQVGTIVPVRIVSLKKDGLIWRAMISTS